MLHYTRIWAVIIVSFVLVQLSHASIIYVDKSATGFNNGNSWTDAFVNLQNAINNATTGDRIWVAAGTYYPTTDRFGNSSPADSRDLLFSLKDGVKLFGGFLGTETMLSERDPDLNPTILSGDIGVMGDSTDNCYIVVLGIDLTEGSVFDGFRVRRANAVGTLFDTSDSTYSEAGAMRIEDSRLTIRNTGFSGNYEGVGSGLHSIGSELRIVRCRFFNNTGTSAYSILL